MAHSAIPTDFDGAGVLPGNRAPIPRQDLTFNQNMAKPKHSSIVSAEDLRAAIACSGIPGYVIGARARVNPIRLSRLCRGHDRISPELAERIFLAIQKEQQEVGDAR